MTNEVVKEFKEIFDLFPELSKDVGNILLVTLKVRLKEFWDYGRLELLDEQTEYEKTKTE